MSDKFENEAELRKAATEMDLGPAIDTVTVDASPAVPQRDEPAPNVRLRDSTETEFVPYIAYWRTGDLQIDFPPEDEARQGWYCADAGELLATCPAVEPIEPIEA